MVGQEAARRAAGVVLEVFSLQLVCHLKSPDDQRGENRRAGHSVSWSAGNRKDRHRARSIAAALDPHRC